MLPPLTDRGPLSIAQVTPHPWGARHEVNEFVARVSAELADRGHRVVIAAPSESRAAIRESRRHAARAAEATCDGALARDTPRRRMARRCSPSARACRCRAARGPVPRRSRSTSAGRWSGCSAAARLGHRATSTIRSRRAPRRRRCGTRTRSTSGASTSPASGCSRRRSRGRWSRSSSAGSTRAPPPAGTTGGADGALLPRDLRAGAAGGPGCRAVVAGRRITDDRPGADRLCADEERGACGSSCGRCGGLAPRANWEAAVLAPGARRRCGSPAASASGCTSCRPARRSRPSGWSPAADVLCLTSGGSRLGARAAARGARVGDGPGSRRTPGSTRSSRRTASAGCSSRPATRSPWRASSSA